MGEKTAVKAPPGFQPVSVKQFSFSEDGITLTGKFVEKVPASVQSKPTFRYIFEVIETSHPDFKPGDMVGCLEIVQLRDGMIGAQPGNVYWLHRTGKKKGGQGNFFEMEIFKK